VESRFLKCRNTGLLRVSGVTQVKQARVSSLNVRINLRINLPRPDSNRGLAESVCEVSTNLVATKLVTHVTLLSEAWRGE